MDCGFLLFFCIHDEKGGRIFRLSHSRWVNMDITGTDLAVSILFTFQSLILAELGLKLGVKSAFVLCIFHILLARKSKRKWGPKPGSEVVFFYYESCVFRTSPVTFCKTIRATADW